ncbi:hypothetical protein EVAR_18328_1 [Eumeta japonica]|uniref:Uncharacterized protein n=1 Tax=Eumeta variegata TaxID=151549 RepID=A0A4C1V8W6_EUMVA|nr:hypothetical protein EVAR_18328_1 [Eumeta japonica]
MREEMSDNARAHTCYRASYSTIRAHSARSRKQTVATPCPRVRREDAHAGRRRRHTYRNTKTKAEFNWEKSRHQRLPPRRAAPAPAPVRAQAHGVSTKLSAREGAATFPD